MAASYTRRINLYINGKEVSADLVSIRREMSKLVNEQARMTMGSKEYIAHTSKIKSLKRIIDQHNQSLSTTHKKWNLFQRMADASNRYFAVITAGIASMTGAAMVVKQTVEAFAEYDDKLVDVMKTTDLTKKATKDLSAELKKIDTRTTQLDLLSLARVAGKLGLRGQEDILGFVRATDKIKVALSEDLGGDTEESVRQLGKLMDIFHLTNDFTVEESLLKIGSAMNALGASGTANEAYMLEFTKRVAGVAPTAGFTIDKILGLATTLDELGQTSEVSGTAFNQVVSKMFKNTAKFAHIAGMALDDFTKLLNEDANEAMIQLLIGAKGTAGGFGELANSLSDLGMDGVRATTVLASLAANIDRLRENQKFSNEEFVKGTDIIIEYNKKNNSAQARLEKHIKTFKDMQVVLGEKLTPIYGQVIHKASTLLKVFGATIEFLFKYGKAILFATGYLLAYAAAAKLVTLWETRKNVAQGIGLILTRANMIANRAGSAAMLLYAAAVAALTGNFKRAAVAMRLFMAFAAATPLGIFFIALGALIIGIKSYEKFSEAALNREYERKKALKDLSILTDAYTGHVDTLNKALRETNTQTHKQKIEMAAVAAEMIGAAENALRLAKLKQQEIKELYTTTTVWQDFVILLKGADMLDLANDPLTLAKAMENGEEAAAEMNEGIGVLKQSVIDLKGGLKGLNDIRFAEDAGDKIGTQSFVMMSEKLAKYQIALDNAIYGGEAWLRIRKKMDDVNALKAKVPGTEVPEDEIKKAETKRKELEKRKLDNLTASFNKEQSVIRQGYLEKSMTENEYNHQMLLTELKFLADKLKIYKAGSKEYQEAVNEALELQVKVDEKLRDLKIKAEDELAAANIKNIRNELTRQLAAEDERWFIQKQAILKRRIDKIKLNSEELAINVALNAQLLANEKLYQQNVTDLKAAAHLTDLQNLTDVATPFSIEFSPLEKMQAMFDAKNKLIEAQHDFEVNAAEGNHSALLLAEKHYTDSIIQLKLETIDAEFNQKEQRIAASQEFITALSGIVDQETALGKALFLFNQGLAIAEIWVSVAKANAAALTLGPGAVAMIPFNTAIGIAQSALVLAQTVQSFQGDGYSEGGYTTKGNKDEPAGIVHKSEYVISKEMLANPQVRHITEVLEKVRTRKINLNSQAFPLLKTGGFSTVNRSRTIEVEKPARDNTTFIQQQNQINRELTAAISAFMQYRPPVAIESIERELTKYKIQKNTQGIK